MVRNYPEFSYAIVSHNNKVSPVVLSKDRRTLLRNRFGKISTTDAETIYKIPNPFIALAEVDGFILIVKPAILDCLNDFEYETHDELKSLDNLFNNYINKFSLKESYVRNLITEFFTQNKRSVSKIFISHILEREHEYTEKSIELSTRSEENLQELYKADLKAQEQLERAGLPDPKYENPNNPDDPEYKIMISINKQRLDGLPRIKVTEQHYDIAQKLAKHFDIVEPYRQSIYYRSLIYGPREDCLSTDIKDFLLYREFYEATRKNINILDTDLFIVNIEYSENVEILTRKFIGEWYDRLDFNGYIITGSIIPGILSTGKFIGNKVDINTDYAEKIMKILYPTFYTDVSNMDINGKFEFDEDKFQVIYNNNQIVPTSPGSDVDIGVLPGYDLKETAVRIFEIAKEFVEDTEVKEIYYTDCEVCKNSKVIEDKSIQDSKNLNKSKARRKLHIPCPRCSKPRKYLISFKDIRHRNIEIYPLKHKYSCFTHHVAPVRGLISKEDGIMKLRISQSAWLCYQDKMMAEYYMFKSQKYEPSDIILKYMCRGFVPVGNVIDKKDLFKVMRSKNMICSMRIFTEGRNMKGNILEKELEKEIDEDMFKDLKRYCGEGMWEE